MLHEDIFLTSLVDDDRMIFRSDNSANWRLLGPFTIGAVFRAQWATQPAPDIDDRDIRFILTVGVRGGADGLKP